MSLLDQAKALPDYKGAQARRRWAEFVEPYFILRDKSYTKTGAALKLAELAGLNDIDANKLHRASKHWKR